MAEVAKSIIQKLKEAGLPIHDEEITYAIDNETQEKYLQELCPNCDVDNENISGCLSNISDIKDHITIPRKYDLEELWIQIGKQKSRGVLILDPINKVYEEHDGYLPIPQEYRERTFQVLTENGFKKRKAK